MSTVSSPDGMGLDLESPAERGPALPWRPERPEKFLGPSGDLPDRRVAESWDHDQRIHAKYLIGRH